MQISINNLKKCFGEKVAVDIESLDIHNGDIIGLVGNNGAGKTTLFRLMLDLLKADDGHVSFVFANETESTDAIDPSQSEAWKEFTGAYIDEGFLIDFLTAEEFFTFVGKVCGLTEAATFERVHEYDSLMNGEILDQKKLIRDYSAGNKQKIGIIAALLNHPQLLVLDEPFNFLDPSSQNILKHTLTAYREQTGATILVSSHNLQHTIDISNRITLMEHGHIIRDIDNHEGAAQQELEAYFNVES